MSRKNLRLVLIYILVAITLIFFIFPIIWMVITAFKPEAETQRIPPAIIFSPTLNNFFRLLGAEVGSYHYGQFLFNSIVVAVFSTMISIPLGTLAAYGLARFSFRGNYSIAFSFLAGRFMPPIATAIPLYLMFNTLGAIDKYHSIVTVHALVEIPFVVWLMRGFFLEVPSDLDDSAMVDGCSRIGALFRVILPTVRPGLFATIIFTVIVSWNEFLFALILTRVNTRTLPVAATEFIVSFIGYDYGAMSAAGVVIGIPIIAFALMVQKHLIKGMTLGAVRA